MSSYGTITQKHCSYYLYKKWIPYIRIRTEVDRVKHTDKDFIEKGIRLFIAVPLLYDDLVVREVEDSLHLDQISFRQHVLSVNFIGNPYEVRIKLCFVKPIIFRRSRESDVYEEVGKSFHGDTESETLRCLDRNNGVDYSIVILTNHTF